MFKSKKLKDPRTCRIFFSSPFGGMEEEREELTRKYFPQIRHLCNERGIHFVPVDMRWGITKESAQNGQVLNICLREIDRSDIFVGFFGQRYGWHSAHGASHGLLEKNFDNAVINYPWVEDYWDRSMTEVEFHHGHLNNPGEMPTIICFRAKKFDDDKYKQYMELGKESMALKYLSESVEAAQQMDSLKTEVKETKDKCLAIDMEYKHPHEFAELIFETLSKYLNEILKPQTELSPRAEMLVDHDNLMMSTRRVYVGGDNYFQQLDDHRKHDKHVFLSGPAGSGKSALLSNWVEHLNETEEELIVIYHFIGCGGNSSKPLNISLRLRLEAQHALQMIKDKNEVQEVSEDKSEDEKSAGKTSDIDKPSADSVRENLNQFRKAVEEIMSDPDRKLVIIVDAIEKAVDDSGKVTKPLYWLPDKLPPGVFIVASSLDTNKIAQEELVDKRQYQTLQMQPLSQDMKHEICVKILQKRGKEFSTEQLQKVVSSKLTANPLFLVITIHELSVFGYFRKLDQKIESLLACESIQQLLNKYLDRMEKDYNVQEYPDNLVKTVFSALFVAHVGLTESELQEAFHIPKPVFSPLYFAMERFIVSHTGPIWFAFSELRDAIEERYLQTEEDRLVITRKLISFFEEKRKGFSITMDYLNTSTIRPAYELPWLQKSIDDKEGLARTLTDLFIFSRLYQERDYELLDLWKSTGYSFIQYGEMFEKEFDTRLVEYYMLYNDGAASSNKPPGVAMLIFLEQMQDFFELALCKLASMQMSNRIIGILNNVENVDNYEEQSRQKKLANHKYQLACSYCDTERYADGKKLHYDTLEYYKKALENGDLTKKFAETRMAWCYNGLGLIARYLGKLQEAKELLQKSHDIHKEHDNKRNMADALQNLGLVALDLKEYDKAIAIYEDARKIYEEKFFGTVPHIIGNLLTNVGLCYRRKNDLVSAEKNYLESLRVKANAVGWDHPIIAVNYMNLGTLEMVRKNWKAAEDYAKKCIEIYKINLYPEDNYNHRRALENLLFAWMMMDRYDDEVQDMFWRLYTILVGLNEMDNCLPGVHHRMAKYFIDNGRLEDANKILVSVMNCKKRSRVTYLHMDELDSLWPEGHKPERPVEMTLDYAMQNLYKNSGDLNNRKLEKYLIPREDIAGIFHVLQDSETDFDSDDYTVMADHCVNKLKGTLRLGINILLEGLKVCPESQQIVFMLISFYHDNKQSKEAFPYVQDLLEGKYPKFKQQPIVSRFSKDKTDEKEPPDSTVTSNMEINSLPATSDTDMGKTSEQGKNQPSVDLTSGTDKIAEDGKAKPSSDEDGKTPKDTSVGTDDKQSDGIISAPDNATKTNILEDTSPNNEKNKTSENIHSSKEKDQTSENTHSSKETGQTPGNTSSGNVADTSIDVKSKSLDVEGEKDKEEEMDEGKKKTLASSYLKCADVAIECESKPVAEHFFNKVIATKVKESVKLAQEAIEKYELDITEDNLKILLELTSDPTVSTSHGTDGNLESDDAPSSTPNTSSVEDDRNVKSVKKIRTNKVEDDRKREVIEENKNYNKVEDDRKREVSEENKN